MAELYDGTPDYSDAPEFGFRVGAPDARLFPYAAWRRLLTSQLRPSAMDTGIQGPVPRLRLGFLVHPPSLRHALHAAKLVRAQAAGVVASIPRRSPRRRPIRRASLSGTA
jgi:DNA-binding transcriptional MocR family regulator